VAQGWAGATWGAMAVPRVGQELVISYLSGDPDQPIATGRTYRETNLPPYELPKHKTRMTIKSRTHKGEGFNELRFEDELGQEEVYIHAEKDKTFMSKTTIVFLLEMTVRKRLVTTSMFRSAMIKLTP